MIWLVVTSVLAHFFVYCFEKLFFFNSFIEIKCNLSARSREKHRTFFIQQIAVRCWSLKFRPTDHMFLHKCHVFSNISKILSKSDEGWGLNTIAREKKQVGESYLKYHDYFRGHFMNLHVYWNTFVNPSFVVHSMVPSWSVSKI